MSEEKIKGSLLEAKLRSSKNSLLSFLILLPGMLTKCSFYIQQYTIYTLWTTVIHTVLRVSNDCHERMLSP